jgi:hypothetical protein
MPHPMEPEQRDIQIPLDPSDLGGEFLSGKAVVLAEREGRGVAEIEELDDEQAVGWLEEFDKV